MQQSKLSDSVNSEQLERELEEKINVLNQRLERWGRNALFIVGGLILSYKLYELLINDKTKDGKENTNHRQILENIVSIAGKQLGLILLAYLKERLVEYLAERAFREDQKKQHNHEEDTQ
jgi:hypothetical protein